MDRDALRGTLRRLARARRRLDAAQAAYDALRDSCRDHMIAEKLETLEVDGYKLEYKTVTASSVDVKALKFQSTRPVWGETLIFWAMGNT